MTDEFRIDTRLILAQCGQKTEKVEFSLHLELFWGKFGHPFMTQGQLLPVWDGNLAIKITLLGV